MYFRRPRPSILSQRLSSSERVDFSSEQGDFTSASSSSEGSDSVDGSGSGARVGVGATAAGGDDTDKGVLLVISGGRIESIEVRMESMCRCSSAKQSWNAEKASESLRKLAIES